MNKRYIFAGFLALAGINGQVVADGDAAVGKTKSATCAGCHGADGNSVNPEWPSLAGQHPKYIIKQLREFKVGERTDATMAPMAAVLSEQDQEDLAAYYASQQAKPAAADETLVELGQKIYQGGNPTTGVAACIGCHGPAGRGNPAANFPSISGQHAKYTTNQLFGFKKNERTNDAGKMMRTIAGKMNEEEIRAVSSYVQGLH